MRRTNLFTAFAALSWAMCMGQSVPTTQPAGDDVQFRSLEAGGTLVLIQRRQNPTYDVMSGRWWESGWHDSFVWRPGYNWAAFYGWEARHITADGRWIVLHKYGQLPKTVAVLKTLENYRAVVWWRCDFDRDGDIDQADFGTLQAQLGRVGPLSGDLDGDGMVDDRDVDLWWRAKAETKP